MSSPAGTADGDGADELDEPTVPTTRAVAERLGIAGDRLKRYVEFHTDPSVATVVAIADSVTLDDVDAETRAGIDRWIDDVRAPATEAVLEDAADDTADGDDDGELWPALDARGFEVTHE